MTPADPLAVRQRAASSLRLGAALPNQVLLPELRPVGFLGYPEMSGANFWEFLRRLGAWSGDGKVAVISMDPDYVERTDGLHGAFEIPLSSSAHNYRAELDRNFPAGQYLPDLLISKALAWLPRSRVWAIYGEREVSTVVVASRRAPEPSFEEMARESGLPPLTLEEILDIARMDFGLYDQAPELSRPGSRERWEAYAAEFRRNYGTGDPAGHGAEGSPRAAEMRARAVAIAQETLQGQRDLLNGCRLLVTLLGADLAETEAGRAIIGLTAELKDVPDQGSRPLYAEGYLRRVDAKVERHLQTARPPVIEACRRIIELYG